METLELRILEIIRNHAIIEKEMVTIDSSLSDAGIDSLGMIEIIFEIEDEFDIDIPDPSSVEDRFIGSMTICQLGTIVQQLIDEKTAPGDCEQCES